MKLKLFILALLTLASSYVYAQEGGVTGRVVNRVGRYSIAGVEVVLYTGSVQRTYTAEDGRFTFSNVNPGTYRLLVNPSSDWQPVELRVIIEESVKDIGLISLAADFVAEGFDESDLALLENEGGDAQAMPVVLSASRDIFDNIASYKFSTMRFRSRGYDSGSTDVYLNGIYFNDPITGYSPWSLWSGLNDATRNQEITTGSVVSDYGVAGVSGSTNINARASQIRKGYRFSVVNASGQYRLRVMATYGSGELDNGWSYALSVSTRQGGNDWVNGVYYNSWGYFGSVEKKINPFHRIGLTILGAPGERAVQGASTQEVYDLVGSNQYNPNWGYQGGTGKTDMRNARVRLNHEPITMLNYFWEPTSKTNVAAAFSYRFGKNGYTALDWYDTQDPRPDYYRNLPSYFVRPNQYYDEDKAAWAAYGWQTDWNVRQINWDRLYDVNRNSYFEADGTEYYNGVNPVGMTRSKYVIEERRQDPRDFNAKLQVNTLIGDNGKLSAGFDLRINRTEYFKKLKDLLGGDYYLDVDQFAERDFPRGNENQSNLNTPNRLVKEGDTYGYHYYAHTRNDKLWATYRHQFSNVEVYVAAENGHTQYWREGLYKKGLFPNNSLGKSEKQNFWTYSVKAGFNYRITGTQTLYAGFTQMTKAPFFQDAFISPRTRNSLAPNMTTEKTTSVDLNYALRLPTFRARITGFYTQIKDRMDVVSFYDDLQQSYTNFAMSGIDQMHTGVEFGISVPIYGGLTAEGVLSYGYYIYNSNPYVTQTVDNSEDIILDNERVYWKDMKIPSTPQTAASVGLRYRGRGNIFAGIDVNYFDAMYISMNPLYRTDGAHVGLTAAESQEMAKQERFDNAFVVNANIGKQWYLRGGYNLGFSLQVNNILNDKDIRTGGYEQSRLYKISEDATKYRRFDSKYFYMMGTTYYLNVYLRF